MQFLELAWVCLKLTKIVVKKLKETLHVVFYANYAYNGFIITKNSCRTTRLQTFLKVKKSEKMWKGLIGVLSTTIWVLHIIVESLPSNRVPYHYQSIWDLFFFYIIRAAVSMEAHWRLTMSIQNSLWWIWYDSLRFLSVKYELSLI